MSYSCRSDYSPITFRSSLEHNQLSPADFSTPLLGFLFPFSAKQFEFTLPRICLIRYVPLSGFLNLLVVFPSNCPEALFHAPSTHGVHPAEFSPWKRHRTFVRCDYLSYIVSFLHLNLPAVNKWIVKHHWRKSSCDLTNTI
jgi:hypothetical protein